MEEQTNTTDWLAQEEATFANKQKVEYEKLPGLQLVQDDITEIDIDISKPFQKWNDSSNEVMKAIVPVTHAGVKKLWWLNIKNPVYAEIIRSARTGQTHFKILTTGTGKNTKYKLK